MPLPVNYVGTVGQTGGQPLNGVMDDEAVRQWVLSNPNMSVPDAARFMQQNGITPEQASRVTGKDINFVTNLYNNALGIKGAGLGPSTTTLQQGADAATTSIGKTQEQVGGLYSQGQNFLTPFQQPGINANNLQANYTGANGLEAQKTAFNNFQYSPGVEFTQGEAERALTRNASATGGLGGGNVLRDLTKLAAGTFMQDFGNQFAQLGQVADRGYGASTTASGMKGQEAQVQSGLGQFAANIPLQTSQIQSGQQFQAGRDISSAISNYTSALSSLQNQQGAGLADMTGNQANNLNLLYQNAMNGDANAKEQLATLLGNMGVQAGSVVGGLPQVNPQPSNILGTVGQVASGFGGLAAGLQGPQQQPSQSPQLPIYTQIQLGLYPGGGAQLSNPMGPNKPLTPSATWGGY